MSPLRPAIIKVRNEASLPFSLFINSWFDGFPLQGRRDFAATSAAPHVSTPDECNQLPVYSERLIHEARSRVDGAGKSTFLREAEADLTTP